MSDGSTPFRDAEAWLAERGVPREPIRVQPTPPEPDEAPTEQPGARSDTTADPGEAEVSTRDAVRLASDAADEAVRRADEQAATPDPAAPRLEDDVAEAVAFLRRSTSTAPQSEQRLRDKLSDRGYRPVVVDAAMERARTERLVDDAAMVAALVDERRRKGHAPARIRTDLRARGFTDEVIDEALRPVEEEDLEAAAFAVARVKAAATTGLSAEAAFRRVAAHVARRGYPDALARKVARSAVFAARDPERTAGH